MFVNINVVIVIYVYFYAIVVYLLAASNFVATNFIGQLTDITLQKNVSFLAKIEVSF